MEPIKQEIIHVDKNNLLCIVKSARGNKYPVHMDKHLADGVQIGDMACVLKDRLANEWIMIDYIINPNGWSNLLSHDQVAVDDEPDYSFNVDGEWL